MLVLANVLFYGFELVNEPIMYDVKDIFSIGSIHKDGRDWIPIYNATIGDWNEVYYGVWVRTIEGNLVLIDVRGANEIPSTEMNEAILNAKFAEAYLKINCKTCKNMATIVGVYKGIPTIPTMQEEICVQVIRNDTTDTAEFLSDYEPFAIGVIDLSQIAPTIYSITFQSYELPTAVSRRDSVSICVGG